MTSTETGQLSLVAVPALGVGGMMGAGLYTLLGLASSTAGGLLPVAFLVAAIAAALSVYSYARLATVFPSRGGAADYLIRGLGDRVVSGGLNLFQYLAYIIATSLYAAGFAEYVVALGGPGAGDLLRPTVAVAVVVLFTVVNLVSSAVAGPRRSSSRSRWSCSSDWWAGASRRRIRHGSPSHRREARSACWGCSPPPPCCM